MIYLDNASTTKVDAQVLSEMLPYLTDWYGNPGNKHALGEKSRAAIQKARSQVAKMIGAKPDNIIFTSSGSEANSMVFRGLSNLFIDSDLYSVATSNAEHKSVIEAADNLYVRRTIPVDEDGSVSVESVKEICDIYDDVALVSVMHTNNETGSVSDVKSIARFCKERGILFHTDCVQAAGFHKLDVEEIGCDFMTISAHKIHGCKGVGALYVRDMSIIDPMIFGGSAQEFGLRGGTENVAGIVGFGCACELVSNSIDQDRQNMARLCKMLQDNLLMMDGRRGAFATKINGQLNVDKRILNICFPGVDAETLLVMLDCCDVAVSAGAACNNNETEPSYVLTSMGVSRENAMCSIRISLSKYTTENDILGICDTIHHCVKFLEPKL